MSRGLDDTRDHRDDSTRERPSVVRTHEPARPDTPERPNDRSRTQELQRPQESARTPERASRDAGPLVPTGALDLPRTDRRDPVEHGGRTYHLRESEVRLLATVGTFRSVAAHDLEGVRSGQDVWRGDLQRLSDQGLIARTTITMNHEPTAIVTLTREGRDLLDSHQRPHEDHARQAYYADLVKPRELAHDAQLYRLFRVEAAEIEAAGGRVERIVIDAELKREYQTFLNRRDRDPDRDAAHDADMRAFADAWQLPIVDDHLALPDVRIEYETADGRLEHRDVELVTEHYSRGQLAGKARAGFATYRAAGGGGRRGGTSRRGGTPFDPHHLEGLV